MSSDENSEKGFNKRRYKKSVLQEINETGFDYCILALSKVKDEREREIMYEVLKKEIRRRIKVRSSLDYYLRKLDMARVEGSGAL